MMEYLTGVRAKEALELKDLLKENMQGQTVKVNGAVHAIRDMGNIAFVILRKRDGLLQCIFDRGNRDIVKSLQGTEWN